MLDAPPVRAQVVAGDGEVAGAGNRGGHRGVRLSLRGVGLSFLAIYKVGATLLQGSKYVPSLTS